MNTLPFFQTSSDSTKPPALKREKKQTGYRFFTVDNPEEHHGHPHHHHPDAHFPGAPFHHHHGTEQTDHVDSHQVVVPGRRVIVKTGKMLRRPLC